MNKNILITGASSGLGEGMAKEFATKGYDLALCARRLDRLEALKQELLILNPSIKVIVKELDVNKHADVFQVFNDVTTEFGHLDRVVVNAGIGTSRRIGTGHFEENRATLEINLISAMAQCESAVEIFRRQNAGHLVTMSSMSAVRGLPKHLTAYAASKAGLASLSEGIRAELLDTPIKVTTLFTGYIRTDLNAGAKNLMFSVDAETGSKALVKTIERAPGNAYVPFWPWSLVAILMRNLPLSWLNKMG